MGKRTWRMPGPLRSRTINYLAGVGRENDLPKSITAPGMGGKFDTHGRVLTFPGNTFLCHIDKDSEFYRALGAVQDGLKASKFAEHHTLLPKPSLHMTMFCGVSGSPLGDDGWPAGVAKGTPLEEINSLYVERLENWPGATEIDVNAVGMSKPGSVTMAPATEQDKNKLSDARQRLQKISGIYRPDIATYEFHISLGYLTRWIAPDDADEAVGLAERLFSRYLMGLGPQRLGPIEFCKFRSMHHFEPVKILEQ